jgi:hypothetical protein
VGFARQHLRHVFSQRSSTQEAGKAVVGGLVQPPPPRCRDGVDSPYLPACGFPAPGDPRIIAS